jgi:hypothetical protein
VRKLVVQQWVTVDRVLSRATSGRVNPRSRPKWAASEENARPLRWRGPMQNIALTLETATLKQDLTLADQQFQLIKKE